MSPPSASTELLFDGADSAAWKIALAHGAGAGMDTPFMNAFSQALAQRGYRVARFEFPYMAQRRQGGGGRKRPPDREAVLRATWLEVIERLGSDRLVIGGKSMGGRIASLVADEAGVAGLVCLGYPFHPVGKPHQLRIAHLQKIETPTLILQGERDPFGNRDEVAAYELPSVIRVEWMPDGDHSSSRERNRATRKTRTATPQLRRSIPSCVHWRRAKSAEDAAACTSGATTLECDVRSG